MRKIAALYLVLTLSTLHINGQTDSLILKLQSARGTERVDLLNELSFAEAQSQPAQAIIHANEAAKLADALDYPFGKSSALHKLGIVYRFQGLYDQAIAMGDSALQMTAGKWPALEASIYSNQGVCYRYKSEYEKALESFQKSIDLHRQSGTSEDLATVLNSVGVMFMYLEDYPKALEYYQQALTIQSDAENLKEVANILNNFAIIYANQGILDSSLHYFEKSLDIERQLGNQKGISESINNIGAVYFYMGDYEQAINAFRESYRMDSLLGNVQGMVVATNNIAEMLNANGQPERARTLLEANIGEARRIDSKYDVEVAYQNLAESFSLQGNYQKAFETYQLYAALHDTVMGEQQQNAIAEMETRFQTKEKEDQILIQNLQLEEQEATIEARQNLIFGLGAAIIFILVSAGFGYSTYRARREAAFQRALAREQEKRIDAVIDATETERKRLARELHDGIGQQLSGIKIALSNAVHSGGDALTLTKIQTVVDESARDVRALSHQMMPKALTELGLVPALEDMLAKSLGLAGITYHFDAVNADVRFPEKIEINLFRISQELVNNILKHAKATRVDLQIMKTGGQLILIVEDDGVGIRHKSDRHSLKDLKNQKNFIEGHGWMNIETRLRSINATWTVDEERSRGMGITVRVTI